MVLLKLVQLLSGQYGTPPLIELTETRSELPGTNAMFFLPTMPGPEIKKANASLNKLQTFSGYSSEARQSFTKIQIENISGK
jgi:hypothetical protein